MSTHSNKRARTDDSPDQWSSFRQAWNASSLAERVTELEQTNAKLEEAVETLLESLESHKKNILEKTEQYSRYKKGFETAKARLEQQCKVSSELQNTIESQQEELESKNNAYKELEAQMELIRKQNSELLREVGEHKARAKTWRVRYEKLVVRGAEALASKTVAEYGVTPDEVTLYKNFASKQAEAARAAEEARKAAVQATSLGLKALENGM